MTYSKNTLSAIRGDLLSKSYFAIVSVFILLSTRSFAHCQELRSNENDRLSKLEKRIELLIIAIERLEAKFDKLEKIANSTTRANITVKMSRPKQFTGSGQTFILLVNGREVESVGVGGTVEAKVVDLPPGENEFAISSRADLLKLFDERAAEPIKLAKQIVSIKNGDVVNIELGYGDTPWIGQPKFYMKLDVLGSKKQ